MNHCEPEMCPDCGTEVLHDIDGEGTYECPSCGLVFTPDEDDQQ